MGQIPCSTKRIACLFIYLFNIVICLFSALLIDENTPVQLNPSPIKPVIYVHLSLPEKIPTVSVLVAVSVIHSTFIYI